MGMIVRFGKRVLKELYCQFVLECSLQSTVRPNFYKIVPHFFFALLANEKHEYERSNHKWSTGCQLQSLSLLLSEAGGAEGNRGSGKSPTSDNEESRENMQKKENCLRKGLKRFQGMFAQFRELDRRGLLRASDSGDVSIVSPVRSNNRMKSLDFQLDALRCQSANPSQT